MAHDINVNDLRAANMVDAQQRMAAIYKAPTVKCPECGSRIFHEAVILKNVSGFYSGTGKDELVPIPVYVCDKCGKIPDEFLNRPAAKQILGDDIENSKEESKEESKDNLIIK